jgi:hypothetical protein
MKNTDIAQQLRLGGDDVEIATATLSNEKLTLKLRLRRDLVSLLDGTCARDYLPQICDDYVHRSQPFDHHKFNTLCAAISSSSDPELYDVFGSYVLNHLQGY